MENAGFIVNRETFPRNFLGEFPLSCLKNIITIKKFCETRIDVLFGMIRFITETLIEAFNEEKDLQIKAKIAFALGKLPPQGRFPNTSKKCLKKYIVIVYLSNTKKRLV